MPLQSGLPPSECGVSRERVLLCEGAPAEAAKTGAAATAAAARAAAKGAAETEAAETGAAATEAAAREVQLARVSTPPHGGAASVEATRIDIS